MSEYMENLTLQAIADACGGEYFGSAEERNNEIAGVVIDSRLVEKDFLFIAIPGERVDGHDFIATAFEKGARGVITEKKLENCEHPYILVQSGTEALKKIAAYYRSTLTIPVIGITGSVGKTSTKEMISSVLGRKYKVLKTAGNFNNEIGLPLTILRIRKQHQVAVVEMGISDFGEMSRLARIARPNIAVITNIGWCHLEQLKDREGILKAKTEMFDYLSEDAEIVLNGDDDCLSKKQMVHGKKVRFYGFDKNGDTGVEKDVYAKEIHNFGFEGSEVKIVTPAGELVSSISIPGEHNIYNALAATQVGLLLGLSLEEIAAGIQSARTIQGRTNFIYRDGMIFIDDCYNANPVSMKTAIELLSHARGRSIAVLGDMGELGQEERALHREVGEEVGRKKIHSLFCTGELAREYVQGAGSINPECHVFYFQTKEQLLRALQEYLKEGDSVLIKASHFMSFNVILENLTQGK